MRAKQAQQAQLGMYRGNQLPTSSVMCSPKPEDHIDLSISREPVIVLIFSNIMQALQLWCNQTKATAFKQLPLLTSLS